MLQKAGLTFDEALTQYIGEFGAGQKKTVFLASLLWLANAFVFFVWVFASLDPVSRHQWSCKDPSDTACRAVFESSDPKHGFCGLDRSQWNWSIEASVVAHFDLVCQNAWKVQFVNTAMFIGCFTGAGLFGQLNDRFGRRLPLFGATALVATCMFASAVSPNYWFLMVLRIITGIGAAGQSQCIMLISTETAGPSFRGIASVMSLAFITLGEFLLVALAYGVPNWRYLTLAAAGLNAVGLLLFPFVSESARWLLSKGRVEEALAVLRNITIINHTTMPLEPLIAGVHVVHQAGSPSDSKDVGVSSSNDQTLAGAHPLQNSGGSGAILSGAHALYRAGSGVVFSGAQALQHNGGSGIILSGSHLLQNSGGSGVVLSGTHALQNTAGSNIFLSGAQALSGAHALQNSGGSGAIMSGVPTLQRTGGSGVLLSPRTPKVGTGSVIPFANPLQNRGGSAVVINIKAVDEDDLSSLDQDYSDSSSGSVDSSVDRMRLRTLLRNPSLLLRALVLLLVWFTLYFSGYGVVLGSGALPGSVYMTFALMAAAELTGMCASAFMVDRLGRHNILTFGLLLGGSACLGCANAVKAQTVQAVLAIFGKFGCSMASAVLGTYTSENYPTPVRARALGMFNQAARCGSIAAPLMLMLGSQLGPGVTAAGALVLPYLAFGGVSVLSGLLVVFMPETLGADMPESMEDLKQLQTLFSAKPWQNGWKAAVTFLFRRRAVPRRKQVQLAPETLQNSIKPTPPSPGGHPLRRRTVPKQTLEQIYESVVKNSRAGLHAEPETLC